MRMRSRFPSVLAATLSLAALASAQAPLGPRGATQARVSPLIPMETFGQMGMRFATDPGLVEALDGALDVTLHGVTVPTHAGFLSVDLALSRVDPVSDSALVQVNGEIVGGAAMLREGVSLWTGIVAGEEGSDVYLAFTPTGTRGWIARADGRSHFFAVPDGGDWNATTTLLVHQDDPFVSENTPTWTCETDTSNMPTFAEEAEQGVRRASDAHGYTSARLESTSSGTIEAKISVDTDFQLYTKFNNLTAEMNYVVALWGAISCRFVDAVDVYITLPWLSFYTVNNDPWNTPDNGGSSSQMLNEFRNHYKNTGFPNGAVLAHYMSGANLGGGVAYVNGFCSTNGVAVSGNLHGQTPIPVPNKSSLNWDFVVCAHETGHSFGSPHTHDYCPPVDSCYPGLCTSGTQCMNNGTIMGYCHLCPGGLNNVQTFFHQRVANRMSKVVSVSCICGLCPCTPAHLNGINPTSVVSYLPAGQQVNLSGVGLTGVTAVYVDGVPLPQGAWTIDSYTQMHFSMPTVSHTGEVDVFIEDDCGPSAPLLVHVDPPAEPHMGVITPVVSLVSFTSGLPVTVSGQPGDVAFVLWSPDQVPTVLPGYLSLDIGNAFSTLYSLWTVTIPAKGWETMVFPLTGVPLATSFHIQAAVLEVGSGFPLVTTEFVSAVVWI